MLDFFNNYSQTFETFPDEPEKKETKSHPQEEKKINTAEPEPSKADPRLSDSECFQLGDKESTVIFSIQNNDKETQKE